MSKRTFLAGPKREIPSGQDKPILPAQKANQNTGFASSCPLPEPAVWWVGVSSNTHRRMLQTPGTRQLICRFRLTYAAAIHQCISVEVGWGGGGRGGCPLSARQSCTFPLLLQVIWTNQSNSGLHLHIFEDVFLRSCEEISWSLPSLGRGRSRW